MITETDMTIIEQVRSHKEAIAARHNFEISRIVASARERQERSGRRVLRQSKQASDDQLPAPSDAIAD